MVDHHAQITAEDVPALLRTSCPSFAEVWEDIREEYEDADFPGGRFGYLDAAAFVRHLATLWRAGAVDKFGAVFDMIERLVTEGDEYVSELSVIGYLEGFQMQTATSLGLDPEVDIRPWLRPTSEANWRAINRFWEGGRPIPIIGPQRSTG